MKFQFCPFCLFVLVKKQINVSLSSVHPVIENEFGHNVVKVAVDPRGDNIPTWPGLQKSISCSLPHYVLEN